MTKLELIKVLATETNKSQREAREFLDALQNIVYANMPNEDVKVFDGVIFTTGERKSRNGVNPHSGEAIVIPAKRVPKVRFGKLAKEAVSA